MALPDYLRLTPGTPVVWGPASGSGVTLTLSLDALANGAAYMGAVADLGATLASFYTVQVVAETGTAPTAGNTVEVYLACTHSTSYYPAGVTGSDALYKTGEEQEWLNQLAQGPDAVLVATNDGNAVQVGQPVVWYPKGRYVVPIYYNKLGQALRDEATASNNDSRVILVPYTWTQEDA